MDGSTFNSDAAGSLWWIHQQPAEGPRPSRDSLCRSSGWTFLRDLGEELNAVLESRGVATRVAVIDVDPASGAVSGQGWDAALLGALGVALANLPGVPAEFVAAPAADARAGAVSTPTVRAAIWLAYYARGETEAGATVYGVGSPLEVVVPTGAELPAFGRLPPPPADRVTRTGITCATATSADIAFAQRGPRSAWYENPLVIFAMIATAGAAAAVLGRRAPRLKDLDPRVGARANPRRRRTRR